VKTRHYKSLWAPGEWGCFTTPLCPLELTTVSVSGSVTTTKPILASNEKVTQGGEGSGTSKGQFVELL
jgi:hypothetical protein